MIVDRLYFRGLLQVENSNEQPVQGRLQYFIETFEPKFLRKLMGYDLYTSFEAGRIVTPTVPAIWTNLLTGSGNYPGLVTTDAAGQKQSPIANYIYYWWLRDQATQNTALGQMIPAAQGGKRTNPMRKMEDVWNEMIERVWQFWEYLDVNKISYTDYKLDYTTRREFRIIGIC